jgi:gliding motility associated protien GldN
MDDFVSTMVELFYKSKLKLYSNMFATLKVWLWLSPIILISDLKAQEIEPLPWQQRDRRDMKPLEYEYQREADVFWSKGIWRVIDTRQKMNKPFAYPQRPLAQIIHEAAVHGAIKAYDPSVEYPDQFKKILDTVAIANIGVTRDTELQSDPVNNDLEDTVTSISPLQWDRITKYKIKEVWFFDQKTSSMQVRIMGIAPVMEYYDSKGTYLGDMTMYWVYYPDLRNILAKEEVFNPKNDWQRISWDDLFTMRMFASYIYKESNVYDRQINEYASGTDALLESDRIKGSILEMENDLWEY